MKNECNIIRDLLPLYAEDMVSADSAAYVKEHLDRCDSCREEFSRASEPKPTVPTSSPIPMQKLSRKLRALRIQTALLTAIFFTALQLSIFAVLDAPLYQPYSEGLVSVSLISDDAVLLRFNENVTDFSCTIRDSSDEGSRCCEVEAWTSLWDKWFSHRNTALSTIISPGGETPVEIVYVPNDKTENIGIARYDPSTETLINEYAKGTGEITLPRLSLGYFLMLALAALAFSTLAWLLVRKNERMRVWVERIGLYPIAYIVSHCIVSGITWTSYSLPRDFCMIVFISLLLYAALLLVHSIWHIKLEICEINSMTR